MSYFVTKYPQGTFSWADIASSNMEASKNFLTGLFGWTSEDMSTGTQGMDYTMFYLDGKVVAGGMQKPQNMNNMPSFWANYITVDNLDEMTKKAEELGAKIVMPPMDVMDSGRMAGLQDPTEAAFMLWQPKSHIGAQVVNTAGAMGWNELYTHDLETAKKFYSDLFGWTYDVDKENGYAMIQNKGRANGGMMMITPEMGQMPPNWTVYFTVKNMDESIAKVNELGGTVHMQKNIDIGKIAGIADPSGAMFIIIELSVPPEEWKE